MANRKKTKAQRAASGAIHGLDVARHAIYKAQNESGMLRNGRPKHQQAHGATRTPAARNKAACRGRHAPGADE